MTLSLAMKMHPRQRQDPLQKKTKLLKNNHKPQLSKQIRLRLKDKNRLMRSSTANLETDLIRMNVRRVKRTSQVYFQLSAKSTMSMQVHLLRSLRISQRLLPLKRAKSHNSRKKVKSKRQFLTRTTISHHNLLTNQRQKKTRRRKTNELSKKC